MSISQYKLCLVWGHKCAVWNVYQDLFIHIALNLTEWQRTPHLNKGLTFTDGHKQDGWQASEFPMSGLWRPFIHSDTLKTQKLYHLKQTLNNSVWKQNKNRLSCPNFLIDTGTIFRIKNKSTVHKKDRQVVIARDDGVFQVSWEK